MRFWSFRLAGLSIRCAAALAIVPAAWPQANNYLVHNLVADQPGIADVTDPNLVNPWGIFTTATSPFWVSDAGTGLSTVYTSNDTAAPSASATKPTIPPSAKGKSPALVTGGVANATGGFLIQGKTAPSFIFVTGDGTVSAWASAISATAAQLMVDNSSKGAVYYGLAISATTTNAAPMLYAANFNSGGIDVFDTNYNPVTMAAGAFVDAAVPAGYAPFNIWNLGGKLYVMWAKQNAAKTFWVDGAGLGAVSVFDLNGNLVQHVATGGPLNAPWGVAIAPSTFGAFAGDLLVANFGDGTINAFNPSTGAALGALKDQNGNVIQISGLWGLLLGNGGSGGDPNLIYFTAGTDNELHGLLGSIQAAPTITSSSSVVNAADTTTGIAQNTFVSIYGASLAPVPRSQAASDISGTTLPKSLAGVSVTVDGMPANMYYVSQKQIDILTPVDSATGQVNVIVTNNGLVSNTISATMQTFSPAFFLFKDNQSIAATHSGGALVGATTLYPGLSTPALPGETIQLFATGLGQTNPAISTVTVVSTPAPCANTPTVSVGGASAKVTYCGLVAAGLYQVDVTVPTSAAAGDDMVTITMGSFTSANGATINVQ
jgi:uncharacterized protein (TIGR03118 family)